MARSEAAFTAVVLSCEHASNRVPAGLRSLFTRERGVLATHRGIDIGALPVARRLARALDAPLIAADVTRLVVDLNRSLHHRALWSSFLSALSAEEKRRLLERYYYPYRRAVESLIDERLRGGGRVLHLSVHSFTPVLHGEVRRADLGLLYDPQRASERRVASRLVQALAARAESLRVRRNYPYRGNADGLTTHLRQLYPARSYVGLEIEMNQKVVDASAGQLRMATVLAEACGCVLGRDWCPGTAGLT